MFYIDQLRIPSFPTAFVKTESGFIVRSVEAGLGRWTLVASVTSVDAYPFFAFSDLTCNLEDTGIGVSGSTVPPETEIGSSDQETCPSASKNTGVIPCSRMEVHPYIYFWW